MTYLPTLGGSLLFVAGLLWWVFRRSTLEL